MDDWVKGVPPTGWSLKTRSRFRGRGGQAECGELERLGVNKWQAKTIRILGLRESRKWGWSLCIAFSVAKNFTCVVCLESHSSHRSYGEGGLASLPHSTDEDEARR